MPAGWALDRLDHGDAACGHSAVEIIDIEHPRGEVVDMCAGHPSDISGDRGNRGKFVVPSAVDGRRRQCEGVDSLCDEVIGLCRRGAARCADQPCVGEQRRVEQLSLSHEILHPPTQVRVEETAIGGGQHRREYPEGVERQLIFIDRPECGGDHRHGRRGITQVIEVDGIHPERLE